LCRDPFLSFFLSFFFLFFLFFVSVFFSGPLFLNRVRRERRPRKLGEIFENERKVLFGEFSKRQLLYTDKGGAWSTRDLDPILKEQIVPSSNWKWAGEWRVETDPNIDDDDGWRVTSTFLSSTN